MGRKPVARKLGRKSMKKTRGGAAAQQQAQLVSQGAPTKSTGPTGRIGGIAVDPSDPSVNP